MIVGRVKLTDKKPPEGKQVIFFSNGDEQRPCYGVYKVEKGFEYVIILDSSGEEDYYNLSDYSEWLDESTPAEDWVKVLEENWQTQIAGYYNHDKTPEERKIRNAVIQEYQDLIAIFKHKFSLTT